MGLYKLITEKYMTFRKDAALFHGLLDHAENILNSARFNNYTDEPLVFFRTFVEELGFSKMCVLLPDDNQYKMYFSYGFHSESYQKSISTKDFWEGTLTTLDWINATDENIVPFRQLFSDDDNNEITVLHLKKSLIKDTPVIIIIAESTKQTLVDTEMVDIVLPSLLPYIEKFLEIKNISNQVVFDTEFDTAVNIENSLIENSKGYLFELSLDVFLDSFDNLFPETKEILFNSMFNDVQILTKLPDVVFAHGHTIKIIRFSKSDLDVELYAYQLKKTISPVFSENKSDLFEIEYVGSSSEESELTSFLKR